MTRCSTDVMYSLNVSETITTPFVDDLTDYVLKHPTVTVHATYGLRKTYKGLKPLIDNFKKNGKSVCIVTEKVTLSSHYNRTLKGLGFQHYSDVQGSITTKIVPYIIVQLDSLHRVESHYNVFICDKGHSLVQSS